LPRPACTCCARPATASPDGPAASSSSPAPDHRVGQRHFKGQLDLERHGGHTPAGMITRILQRILAPTAAIWHNDHTGQPVMRSLIAYDYY